MNINQKLAYMARLVTASQLGHNIDYSDNPTLRIASCTCGWRAQVSRRGSALGAVAKLRSRVRQHCDNVQAAACERSNNGGSHG